MRVKLLVFGALMVLGSASARAEVLPVGGIYPAASDAAAAMRSIAVDRFDGEDGPELSLALEDVLGKAAVDGVGWFRISTALLDGGNAEGLLRGTAQADQQFEDYTEEREECVRDDKDKCTPEKRKFRVDCTHRTIALLASIRLYDPAGVLVWSDRPTKERRDSFCEDQDRPASLDAVARELAGQVAGSVRFALAPARRSATIRVNESRKGLEKPLAARFKGAVRLTKSDWPAACREWEAIGELAPTHQPTLFNRALCGEASGDDARAAELYRQLLGLSPASGSAQEGLGRIAARSRALAQIAAHDRD